MKVKLAGALMSFYRIWDQHHRDAYRARIGVAVPTTMRPEDGEKLTMVYFEVSGKEGVDVWCKAMESPSLFNVKVTIEVEQ